MISFSHGIYFVNRFQTINLNRNVLNEDTDMHLTEHGLTMLTVRTNIKFHV